MTKPTIPQVLKRIIEEESARYDVSYGEIIGDVREARVCPARWAVMLRLRRERNWSYPRIGRALGKHHTTVLHGVRKALEAEGRRPPHRPFPQPDEEIGITRRDHAHAQGEPCW